MSFERLIPVVLLLVGSGCGKAATDTEGALEDCDREGCGVDPDRPLPPLPRERDWNCDGVSLTECSCGVDAFIALTPTPPLRGGCHAYECCVLQDTVAPSEAQCICRDGVDCTAEVAARPGSVRIEQCPPPAEDPRLITCAALGEDCSPESREQRGLAGCCDGSLCGSDADARLLCQAAPPELLELAAQCRKVAMLPLATDLRTSGGISTGMGRLEFPTVSSARAEIGARGCINRVDVRLEAQDACSLHLVVEGVGGALTVTSIDSDWSQCWNDAGAGSPGAQSPMTSNPSAVAVSFTGVGCLRASQGHCVTGSLDFYFRGQLGSVTFEDSHLSVDGTLCSAQEADSCLTNAPPNAG